MPRLHTYVVFRHVGTGPRGDSALGEVVGSINKRPIEQTLAISPRDHFEIEIDQKL